MIILEVLGAPAPKGSARAMLIGGRARVIASGSTANQKQLKGWDVAVREAAWGICKDDGGPRYVNTSLNVTIVFRLARPGGHWHPKGGLRPKAPAFPTTKPDIDKLARATLDSLTGIVFDDDSRIVRLVLVKLYAKSNDEGATISIDELAPLAHESERAA